MNTHAAIVSRVSAAALADIEGLNPDTAGFCRPDCCGDLPADLKGSFKDVKLHMFLGSAIPAAKWDRITATVPGAATLSAKVKADKGCTSTVYYTPTADEAAPPLLSFRPTAEAVEIMEYSGVPAGDLPQEAKGTIAVERPHDRYVFVCAHRERDDRCGYCGPILVDLMKARLAHKYKDAPVHVFPCSHVGGHVYAGNVIVYSRYGGRCFGRITPEQVDSLVDYIAIHKDARVPKQLQDFLRGNSGPAIPQDA
jgi:hypothetical protein